MTLLAGAVEDAGRPLAELPLLTSAERNELLADWGMAQSVPAEDALHRVFEARARRTPEVVAVSCGEQQLTYGELNRRANRLARRLRALGVGPETPVPLCVERSPDLVVGILGILKAGGGYVPIDPSYPQERIEWILADSQANVGSPVLVTQTDLTASLPESRVHVVCLDDAGLAAEDGSDLDGGAGPDNLAYVIYTSGSTGRPKGVPVTHANVAPPVHGDGRLVRLRPQRRVDAVPLLRVRLLGLGDVGRAAVRRPARGGAVLREPVPGGVLPGCWSRERVTVLNQTPSAFRQLIARRGSGAQTGPRQTTSRGSLPALRRSSAAKRWSSAACCPGSSATATSGRAWSTCTASPRRRSTSPIVR